MTYQYSENVRWILFRNVLWHDCFPTNQTSINQPIPSHPEFAREFGSSIVDFEGNIWSKPSSGNFGIEPENTWVQPQWNKRHESWECCPQQREIWVLLFKLWSHHRFNHVPSFPRWTSLGQSDVIRSFSARNLWVIVHRIPSSGSWSQRWLKINAAYHNINWSYLIVVNLDQHPKDTSKHDKHVDNN